jgi:signal transduction histidine kinase
MLQAGSAARLGFNRDAVVRSAVDDETSSRFTRSLGVFDGRILVVDDDAAYLDTISAALEALGFEVESARSGEEAVQKLSLSEWPPDCVLLDRQMPGIGGELACQRIRQSSRCREVPIIMVTGCDDRDAVVRALGVGADDYVMKGHAIEILAARLQVQLRRGRQHRELSRAVDMLSAVLATVPDPILAVEPSGCISMANAAAAKMSAESPLGRDVREWAAQVGLHVTNDHDGAAELPAVAALRGAEVDGVEMVAHRGAADSRWHLVSARPLRGAGGAVFGAISVLRDVTNEKSAHEQLLVADRMATLGLLAASVGHEINNPLAALCMNLETVKEELGAHVTSELGQLLDDANLCAERIREVVADLRIFARDDKRALEPTSVNRVVDSSVRLAQTEIRYKVDLSVSLGDVPMVSASASRLGQVVLNLLVNAAQSMDGRTGRKEIRVRTSFDRELRQVVIEVADTGVGIPEADLGRVFAPFFTTKAQGTGLGLSICRRIVRELGGEIEVSSTRDVGTTMRVLLPVGPTASVP